VPRQEAPFATKVLPYGKAAIEEAARQILDGVPVAVPTETVYGLAADATNEQAVARVYEAKGRPSFNPLIVHVLDLDQAVAIGGEMSEAARQVAGRYWPGPLTLVVPLSPSTKLAKLTTAGLESVALRSPDHRAMRSLLEAVGRPLAAPSANASGTISPTRAEHVLKSLGGRIPLVIDDGDTGRGVESTIVKFAGDRLMHLRPGPVDAEEIAAYANMKLDSEWSGRIEAPGQLRSHYAPSKPLRVDALSAEPDEWLIGFGPVQGNDSLSPSGSLVEAASRLFGALHRAEDQMKARIAVAPIPAEGVGLAINDRLRRAAAPRD
jgi:L-threonylcarbamoyladenylate synthase